MKTPRWELSAHEDGDDAMYASTTDEMEMEWWASAEAEGCVNVEFGPQTLHPYSKEHFCDLAERINLLIALYNALSAGPLAKEWLAKQSTKPDWVMKP